MAVFRHPCGWRQQAGPNKRSSPRTAAEDPEDERPGKGGRTNRVTREFPQEGADSRGAECSNPYLGGASAVVKLEKDGWAKLSLSASRQMLPQVRSRQ